MASNMLYGGWNVRIISLPVSITKNQLAETFQIPASRISIPKTQKTITYLAWINDFASEKDAKDFVALWSNSSVFGVIIKCYVSGPKTSERYVHHQPDKTSYNKQLDSRSSSSFKEEPSTFSSSITPVSLMTVDTIRATSKL